MSEGVEKGVEKNTFEVGESMLIKIYVKVSESFRSARRSRIDIGINNILDTRVTWLSTYMYSDHIELMDNCVCFKISKLLLNEGSYNVNLFSTVDNDLADWVKNVARFQVVFHDFYKNGRGLPEGQGYFITDFKII